MKTQHAAAMLRVSIGFTFLWAFLDKTFGLGSATSAEKSWIAGGSPTEGFLSNAARGPFADLFHSMAGSPIVDRLFMLGLLLIGIALILGIGMKIATYTGSLLLFLMWLALLPPTNNPILDEHLVYIFALFTLKSMKAGEIWGLGKEWSESRLVKKFPFLA
ncbi:hypothetical protein HY463_01540 [Candidatus Peregrinibacteria bacterium]|nr:hypothetical protein [Candidatus Peregrinibacteria bacterium]